MRSDRIGSDELACLPACLLAGKLAWAVADIWRLDSNERGMAARVQVLVRATATSVRPSIRLSTCLPALLAAER